MSMSYMTRLSVIRHAPCPTYCILTVKVYVLMPMIWSKNDLIQNRISIKKFRSPLTYSPTLSRAPSSKIIVELAIHVSFKIFLRDCSSNNSKYISTREFYFILPMIQFASLYLSILLDIVKMQDIVLSIILNTPKLYLLSSYEFIWDHFWTDSV